MNVTVMRGEDHWNAWWIPLKCAMKTTEWVKNTTEMRDEYHWNARWRLLKWVKNNAEMRDEYHWNARWRLLKWVKNTAEMRDEYHWNAWWIPLKYAMKITVCINDWYPRNILFHYIYHIEAETKLLPFCRRNFQMHFLIKMYRFR